MAARRLPQNSCVGKPCIRAQSLNDQTICLRQTIKQKTKTMIVEEMDLSMYSMPPGRPEVAQSRR